MTKPIDPLAEARAAIAAVPVWFHVMELGPDLVTPGVYDLRPHLGAYGFPASLEGASVLDVGASDGFFSFHFEGLGAREVVAVEPRSVFDLDYPTEFAATRRRELDEATIADLDRRELHEPFDVAARLLDSRVERLLCTLSQLPEHLDRTFDLVFCGDVIQHLRDPIGGLETLRRYVAPEGKLILSSTVDLSLDESYALFKGDAENASWWVPSRAGLLRMLAAAGFRDPTWSGDFPVHRQAAPDQRGTIGVAHATV